MRSMLADSMSATALASTLAHSSSVFGWFSWTPFASTIVETESKTTYAAGVTMPIMSCLTLATGGNDAAAGGGAAASTLDARPLAMMKPMPEMKSATLTAKSQFTVRIASRCYRGDGRSRRTGPTRTPASRSTRTGPTTSAKPDANRAEHVDRLARVQLRVIQD